MTRNNKNIFLACTVLVGAFSAFYFFIPAFFSIAYKTDTATTTPTVASSTMSGESGIIVTHLATPEPLKAIYMTACVASAPSFRENLVHIADTTEVNSIIIDTKDYSGTIAFDAEDPLLKNNAGKGCRTTDLKKFIARLHSKNIYAIARITVFQDPYYTRFHPELAVLKKSDGTVWKDFKGLSFIDVSAKPYWDYIVALGKEAYAMGFDELNFDYVRFPSDGPMNDVDYSWGHGMSKAEALEHFFAFLRDSLSQTGAKLSVDLFGMTTTNDNDMNIGQVLERALPYFDYVSPMVYPSHYPPLFNGWTNPNDHVYDVVYYSMSKAVLRVGATTTPVLHLGAERIGTSTPAIYTKEAYDKNKLRPWLQDFNYGGIYGATEVRAQIQATYDSGLNSWFLWDPKNLYTKEALKAE